MTKKEYANRIAALVNGEVKEVEKANGVILTGIVIDTGTNVRPCIYIDAMYEEQYTPEEAAEKVAEIAKENARPALSLDFMSSFEAAKPLLRARLYNKATTAEVKRSAAGYGFDDLVIIPYLENVTVNGSIKVTEAILKMWDVTADEVIDAAEENSKNDATMENMAEVLAQMASATGIPAPNMGDVPPLYVISNNSRMFGAYGIIAQLEALKQRFKAGFTVLPSSVHEVIVVDADDPAAFDDMVSSVNAAEVDPEQQLSNHSYRIAA